MYGTHSFKILIRYICTEKNTFVVVTSQHCKDAKYFEMLCMYLRVLILIQCCVSDNALSTLSAHFIKFGL
jgi:hypothetical protein